MIMKNEDHTPEPAREDQIPQELLQGLRERAFSRLERVEEPEGALPGQEIVHHGKVTMEEHLSFLLARMYEQHILPEIDKAKESPEAHSTPVSKSDFIKNMIELMKMTARNLPSHIEPQNLGLVQHIVLDEMGITNEEYEKLRREALIKRTDEQRSR